MQNFLKKKKEFRFSLNVWQIVAVAGAMFLIPYTAWEIFWYAKVGALAIKPHTYIVGFATIIWLLLAPYSIAGFIRKNFLVGVVYVLLCYEIGEVHPFTMMPMYNQFVKYAYTFKVTDEHDKIIPLNTYYKTGSSGLSHKYFTIMINNNIEYGYGKESPEGTCHDRKTIVDGFKGKQNKKKSGC